MLAQREVKKLAECFRRRIPLVITTPGGSYKFLGQRFSCGFADSVLNIAVAANKTVEIMNKPEIKFQIPAMNRAPIRMSFLNAFIVLDKISCVCFSVVGYYTG